MPTVGSSGVGSGSGVGVGVGSGSGVGSGFGVGFSYTFMSASLKPFAIFFVNEYKSAPTTVQATKVWDDESNKYGLRDSVKLRLEGYYEDSEKTKHYLTDTDTAKYVKEIKKSDTTTSAYMNTADEEIKRVVTKYEGKEKVERIRLLVNDYIDLHINCF